MESLVSTIMALLLIMDPVGNSINFMLVLKDVDKEKRPRVIVREIFVACGILLLFLLCGRHLMALMGIKQPALQIAGAVVLFLISLRMIFPTREGIYSSEKGGEPFIVPLATPFIAGPSALAVVMLISASEFQPVAFADWPMMEKVIAVSCAVLFTGIVIFMLNKVGNLLKRGFASGIQRLSGMLICTLSVQSFLNALENYISNYR